MQLACQKVTPTDLPLPSVISLPISSFRYCIFGLESSHLSILLERTAFIPGSAPIVIFPLKCQHLTIHPTALMRSHLILCILSFHSIQLLLLLLLWKTPFTLNAILHR